MYYWYKMNLLVLCLGFTWTMTAQIPVEQYRTEIKTLGNSEDIQAYWKNLEHLDQNVLLKADDVVLRDSISIDNMIRTVLMLEIHGDEVLTPNVSVHILNLSHNEFGISNIAYWPVIKSSKKIKQAVTEQLYPAYVLESIGFSFYGYSFLRKEDKYPRALNQLDKASMNNNTVDRLQMAYNKIKKYRELKDQKIVGTWHQQYFKNKEEKETFQFILKENREVYFKRYDSLNRLVLHENSDNYKVYRVEDEPFGWSFKLEDSGKLTLLDHNKNVLIAYSNAKNED